MMPEYFYECQQRYNDVAEKTLQHLSEIEPTWQTIFGIELCRLDRSFFNQFESLNKLMTDFQSHRHSVFRFFPNTCYGWHFDNPGRHCSLNLLLSGTDSHTYFGTHIKPPEGKLSQDYFNVKEVPYEPGKFILMNTEERHTIYNLNNMRYLLSISFPPNATNFFGLKEHLININF